MTPTQKTRGVILILVLYVVIAVVGFLVVYVIKTTFFPTKSTPPSVNVTKTTKSAIPAGWKTYHDTNHHLSFSYPADLRLKTSSYQFGVSNIEMRSANNTNPNDAADYQLLLVPKSLALAAGQDFDGYYNLPDNTTKQVSSPLSANKSQQNFTKLNTITIAGHRAFNYRSAPANTSATDEAEVGVFIENGNSLILISTGESNKKELNTILKTLQFAT